MVLRQTLQACGARQALREYEADGGSESVPLFRLPLVDVLQECRERVVLEGLLEVLVSLYRHFIKAWNAYTEKNFTRTS